MSPSVLDGLVAKLLLFIAGATGYELTAPPPAVSFQPTAALEQRVCGRPCPVYAVFDSEDGILLDRRLDLSSDGYARSVLLHELVHFAQWKKAGHAAGDCPEWMKRESEAYRIQFLWLANQPPDWRNSPLPRPNRARLHCGHDTTLAAAGNPARSHVE